MILKKRPFAELPTSQMQKITPVKGQINRCKTPFIMRYGNEPQSFYKC